MSNTFKSEILSMTQFDSVHFDLQITFRWRCITGGHFDNPDYPLTVPFDISQRVWVEADSVGERQHRSKDQSPDFDY